MPPNALFHGNIMAMLFYSSPLMRIADFIQWRFFTLLTGSTGVSTSDYFMPLPYYCHEIAMHNRPPCATSSAYITHANTARIAPAPRLAINPCPPSTISHATARRQREAKKGHFCHPVPALAKPYPAHSQPQVNVFSELSGQRIY